LRSYAIIADSVKLKSHVYSICGAKGFRNMNDTAALNITARYIITELKKLPNVRVGKQTYDVGGKTSGHIIGSLGPQGAPHIIIGAHYDVCDEQAGADDNASGVAGLLELARLLSEQDTSRWKYCIDLVAYTLEEPPTFRTPAMGSAVHARSLYENKVDVAGMISIEMIGYYSSERHSQRYPVGFLKLFYGSRGNFITVVKKMHGGRFVRRFTRGFRHGGNIITKVFAAPKWVPGIDFSDHLNYWAYDWDALMITDTSFYRNIRYHEKTDLPETLDYGKMSFVVSNIFKSISGMAK